MREFETAVAQAQEPDDEQQEDGALEFTIVERDADGEEVQRVLCRAFEPGDGQLAFLMATTGRHQPLEGQVAGILNFFDSCLDQESSAYISGRLLDRTDKFGLDDVRQYMEYMAEEWGGRPTKPSNGSAKSQRRGGRRSTPATTPSS